MAAIRSILTSDVPAPGGHYSQAVVHQGLVFVSGQLPPRPTCGQAWGPLAEQFQQVLGQLDAILRAAGSRRDRVLRVTIYVADVAHWPEVNRLYAEFFGDHRPARTVIPCGKLHHGCEVELDAIAAVLE